MWAGSAGWRPAPQRVGVGAGGHLLLCGPWTVTSQDPRAERPALLRGTVPGGGCRTPAWHGVAVRFPHKHWGFSAWLGSQAPPIWL